jgi:hypothetical protein
VTREFSYLFLRVLTVCRPSLGSQALVACAPLVALWPHLFRLAPSGAFRFAGACAPPPPLLPLGWALDCLGLRQLVEAEFVSELQVSNTPRYR